MSSVTYDPQAINDSLIAGVEAATARWCTSLKSEEHPLGRCLRRWLLEPDSVTLRELEGQLDAFSLSARARTTPSLGWLSFFAGEVSCPQHFEVPSNEDADLLDRIFRLRREPGAHPLLLPSEGPVLLRSIYTVLGARPLVRSGELLVDLRDPAVNQRLNRALHLLFQSSVVSFELLGQRALGLRRYDSRVHDESVRDLVNALKREYPAWITLQLAEGKVLATVTGLTVHFIPRAPHEAIRESVSWRAFRSRLEGAPGNRNAIGWCSSG